MKLIPAIDLLDGRCVRLLKGDFGKVTFYDSKPLDLVKNYESMGFKNIHIVDLDATRDGKSNNGEIIEQIIEKSHLKIQLGGGIRSGQDIRQWLDTGINYLIIGSFAINSFNDFYQSIKEQDKSKIIIALDVMIENMKPIVMTHGWKESSNQSLWNLIEKFNKVGFNHYLVTDISKDGTLIGPNIDLYKQCIEKSSGSSFIGSGGVSNIQDLYQLREIGMQASVSGKALLENKISKQEVFEFLQEE